LPVTIRVPAVAEAGHFTRRSRRSPGVLLRKLFDE